jgi:hypothetical protein
MHAYNAKWVCDQNKRGSVLQERFSGTGERVRFNRDTITLVCYCSFGFTGRGAVRGVGVMSIHIHKYVKEEFTGSRMCIRYLVGVAGVL